jgi:hypothetical protein
MQTEHLHPTMFAKLAALALRPAEPEESLSRSAPSSSLTSIRENFVGLEIRHDRNPARSDCFADVLEVFLEIAKFERSEDATIDRVHELLNETFPFSVPDYPRDFWMLQVNKPHNFSRK